MQDVVIALTLSEVVYRALDPGGTHEAVNVAEELCHALSITADTQLRLQWSSPHSPHRQY
jgi:hypothetical protein